MFKKMLSGWKPRKAGSAAGKQPLAKFGFSIYDGLIVAAATRCAILYAEDLQQGQVIDQLTIQNPFAGS
ncbi:MAG: hypothetical protein WB803_11155 [Pseudolabrys sp.]